MDTRRANGAAGVSMLELMFVVALMTTVTAMAVPQVLAGVDGSRARGAARYVAMRMHLARSTAVSRTVHVGVRFRRIATGYEFTMHADGNGNGIRTADVRSGVDAPIDGPERLSYHFNGVEFGVAPGLPPVDSSSAAPGTDPIKFGSSDIVSCSPIGACTSGSVYVLGRGGAQYVVRVLGETGRIRVLRFDVRTGKWMPA